MSNLDPDLAIRISQKAQELNRTKSLMEKAASFTERVELERQLNVHEQDLQRLNIECRARAGPG